MENENDAILNKNESSKNSNEIINAPGNKKNHWPKTFFVFLLILTIFISASCGAFFGFLASRSGSQLLANLKGGKYQKLLSNNQKDQSNDVIKQKIVQEDSAVIKVVKKASPAVVSIVISKDIPKIQSFRNIPDFFGDPFGFFNFGQNNGQDNSNRNDSGKTKTQKQTIGGGTGFFISSDGMIVTNRHVVNDSSASYTVVTDDSKKHPAHVLAIDPVNDIAVIKIDGSKYPTLNLGNSDSVQIGQTTIAIGNSLGQFSNTVSRGIISGLKRNVTAGGGLAGQTEKLNNIIQTDAAINPGNSGGPLLDINGDVIGINVAIAQGAQNIGFAIPANQVSDIVNQVKTTGKISTPFLGVRYIPVNAALQKANNLPYDYGDLVIRGTNITDLAVIPGSPADKAGIVENDIILEINSQKIDSANDVNLSNLIAQHKVGDTVTLKVWHKGQIKNIQVKLSERNNSSNNKGGNQ